MGLICSWTKLRDVESRTFKSVLQNPLQFWHSLFLRDLTEKSRSEPFASMDYRKMRVDSYRSRLNHSTAILDQCTEIFKIDPLIIIKQ